MTDRKEYEYRFDPGHCVRGIFLYREFKKCDGLLTETLALVEEVDRWVQSVNPSVDFLCKFIVFVMWLHYDGEMNGGFKYS